MRWMIMLLGLAMVLAAPSVIAAERGRSLAVGGTARSYLMSAPDKQNAPLPLVIVFHGGGQNAERAQRYTRFDEFAASLGFVAAYPQGLDNNWNDGRVSGDLMERAAAKVSDVEFVSALIDQLVGERIADPERVFLTGASNGGMMAMYAACELGSKVAGIAPVVANQPVDWICQSSGVAALFIHGTEDSYMPFNGGPVAAKQSRKDLGQVRSAGETVAVFQRLNGCTGAKEPQRLDKVGRDQTVAVITDYDCVTAPLKHIVIEGGGHTWPGARNGIFSEWVLGRTSEEVSATAEIWNFFKSVR